MENRQLYNSPQNRSTIRDPRYMVVELRMFISVILNALKRSPERHELWLNFLINTIPYLDRLIMPSIFNFLELYQLSLFTGLNKFVEIFMLVWEAILICLFKALNRKVRVVFTAQQTFAARFILPIFEFQREIHYLH